VAKRRKPKRGLRYTLNRGTANSPPRLNPAELLLELISDRDLNTSRERAGVIQNYHTQLFYELEGQRAAHKDEIRSALQSVPGISVDVTRWCRQIQCRYAVSPLSCIGSMRISGRFNYGDDLDSRFPRFPALYVAEDRATAHCEMFQISSSDTGKLSTAALNLHAEASIAAYALSGTVSQVFDLTQASNLAAFLTVTKGFKLSAELRKMEQSWRIGHRDVAALPEQLMNTFMDPDWRTFPMYADIPANSQVFGNLLAEAGFEGVLYPSIRNRGGRALALFPRNFRNSTSKVWVNDPPPGARCVELSATSCDELEVEM